jgi:hypothetical protein
VPQGADRLRQKYLCGGDCDGIEECERVIKNFGGVIVRGCIKFPGELPNDQELHDAIDYLVFEWDYAYE